MNWTYSVKCKKNSYLANLSWILIDMFVALIFDSDNLISIDQFVRKEL
jgi:hypothetical protein